MRNFATFRQLVGSTMDIPRSSMPADPSTYPAGYVSREVRRPGQHDKIQRVGEAPHRSGRIGSDTSTPRARTWPTWALSIRIVAGGAEVRRIDGRQSLVDQIRITIHDRRSTSHVGSGRPRHEPEPDGRSGAPAANRADLRKRLIWRAVNPGGANSRKPHSWLANSRADTHPLMRWPDATNSPGAPDRDIRWESEYPEQLETTGRLFAATSNTWTPAFPLACWATAHRS
jgi:hypothetical protein